MALEDVNPRQTLRVQYLVSGIAVLATASLLMTLYGTSILGVAGMALNVLAAILLLLSPQTQLAKTRSVHLTADVKIAGDLVAKKT